MTPRKVSSHYSSRTVIYAAIAGNLLVALTKFGAATWTGSSAMLSEGIHSVVDTGNEILLLYGLSRATIQPDREHPLGYGREIYFWSFVVALLVFAVGAGFSFAKELRRSCDRRRFRTRQSTTSCWLCPLCSRVVPGG
jgi:divalent metal cation (Fe/Co/Zn/Cd) transporter